MGNDSQTLIKAPPPAPSSSTLHTFDSTSTSLPSPESVLHTAEIEQSRRMAITGVVFNLVGVASWPLFGGNPIAKRVAMISLAAAALNNAWLWWAASDARRYTQNKVVAYFAVASVLNAGVIYYLGVFGPIVAMFVLNVYTACLGYGHRVAFITLVGSIAPFLALAIPISAGWIVDGGLMSATSYVGPFGRTVVVAAFTAFLVLVYSQARKTRDVIVTSLAERDAAVRTASHREALFLEARRDLENALQAGGLGRFTDQTLGSFKLGAVLARGGMGEVYEAVNVKDGSRAAVKMLLPEVLARADFVRRFLREVHIAASLDSPHVVKVLEIGDESAPLPYLAMERLEGEDLAQILRTKERLTAAQTIDLARQVGDGLAVAKRAGIVHRDLKPQNLFFTNDRTWKILDFGISKLADQGGTLTEGVAVGTPQYMAPEQARSGDVGPAADMYGLGAVAYRALTGCQPFKGSNVAEVLVAVMVEMPVRPSALAELPRDVDLVLAIALAKDPKDRFDSGAALADALEASTTSRLDPKLRRRATKLLDTLPWREP
ncbi:MAG TPA: serine/threonine-protein kinase [Polyangiaceae bacterium]|nr:serine/threonine-protein kinase [Polyangiaceae bacterium]